MRALLAAALLFAACGAPAAPAPVCPTPVAETPTTTPTPVAKPAPPPVDDQTIIGLSHDFFAAYDANDVAKVEAALSPSYLHFERARFYNRELTSKGLANRAERGYPKVGARTWSGERVQHEGDLAIFMGETTYETTAEAAKKPIADDRWVTLVWVRDPASDRWQLAHWGGSRGGLEAEREDWNENFRAGAGFNLKPNKFLTETVAKRKAGVALDVGVGQGRNAIWLAAHGWKVTGVDISDEGIRQTQEMAAREGLKIETINADLTTWDFGKNRYDLVCMIYMGGWELFDKVKASLKPGGIMVLEYFHADAMGSTGAGGFKDGELAAIFKDGFKILHDEVVEDNADYAGMRKMKLVRFVAQKL